MEYHDLAVRMIRAERATTQARRQFIAALLEWIPPGEATDYLVAEFDKATAAMMKAQSEMLTTTMRDLGADLREMVREARERAAVD